MKNIRSFIKYTATGIFLITATIACENDGYDEYDAGKAPTFAMNGEWVIDISDAATGDVLVSHAVHKTYDMDGALYISDRIGSAEDEFTGWWLETPLDANLDALTFSATEQENTADGSIVTLTNGKILKQAATSPSGVKLDSIYFEGVFDYDPETVLIFSGHRRTGFSEDE